MSMVKWGMSQHRWPGQHSFPQGGLHSALPPLPLLRNTRHIVPTSAQSLARKEIRRGETWWDTSQTVVPPEIFLDRGWGNCGHLCFCSLLLLLSHPVCCLWAWVVSRAQLGKPAPSPTCWPACSQRIYKLLRYNRQGEGLILWNSNANSCYCYLIVPFLWFALSFNHIFPFFRSVTDPWSLSQPHNSK